MATWWNPTTWGKLPEPTGTVVVTPEEAESIPKETKATVVVAPSGGGGGSVSGTTIRVGTSTQTYPIDSGVSKEPRVETEVYDPATKTSQVVQEEEPLPMVSEVGVNREVPVSPGRVGTGGGLYFVTPQESKDIGKTKKPVWEVQSGTTYEGMISAIDTESKYAGYVDVSSTPTLIGATYGIYSGEPTLSSGQEESNLGQIKRAKALYSAELGIKREISGVSTEFRLNPQAFSSVPGFVETKTEKGTEYSLGAEFFKTLPSYKRYEELAGKDFKFYLGEAREDLKQFSFGSRVSSKLADLEIGTRQLGLGFAEFGFDIGATVYGNFAFKGMEAGDVTGFKGIKKQFTTQQLPGKRTMKTPVAQPLTPPSDFLGYTKEVFTETPGFVAQTIPLVLGAQFAGTASFGSLTSGIKMLQPIRIKGGTFVPDLKREFRTDLQKGGAKSFEIKKGDTTVSFTSAKTKDFGIGLESTQYTKAFKGKTGGVAYTELKNVPYSYIDPYGQIRIFDARTTITSASYFKFKGTPRGEFGTSIKGTSFYTSEALGSGVQYFDTLSFGKTTGQIGSFETFRFLSGQRVTQFTKTGEGIYPAELVGKTKKVFYSADAGILPDITGTGLRFNWETTMKDVGSGVNIFRGGGTKTPFSKTFGSETTTTIEVPSYQTPLVTGLEGIGGLVTVPKNLFQPMVYSTQIPKTETKTATSVINLNKLQDLTKTIADEKTIFGTGLVYTPSVKTFQGSIPALTQIPALQTKTAQETEQVFAPTQTTFIFTPPTYTTPKPRITGGFGILPFGLGGAGFPKTRRYKGKRKFKYTPSYEAFIFNIRGSKPKGIETGARIRPITKGFSFVRTRIKMPSFSSSFNLGRGFGFLKTKRKKKKRK